MPSRPQQYEVISVSLPRDLVKRANALIPRTRRSRVLAGVLTTFLDSIERKKLEQAYRVYYAQRSPKESEEERELLDECKIGDEEAWAILEKEESVGSRPAR